jgi:ribulose-bisphosphate carboxylase large chain
MPRLHVRYRVRARADEIDAIAQALALEQSVEVPLAAVRDAFVRDHVVGTVAGVAAAGDGAFDVGIDLAAVTTGDDAAQTLNMLFGNSSLHPHVELVDVDLPAGFAAHFGGPRFGIAGIRARIGVADRPLTCAALKPQGLGPAALAALCATFARAGIDVVKDDHGIADQAYAPFAERVRACQQAIRAAERETGRRTLYAPSLVGGPRRLREQLAIARDEGVAMLLIAPALVGIPAFHELVADGIGMPVLAHPAWAGAARVAPPLLLGKLFRLFGADAVVFPHSGGRFAYTPADCAGIAAAGRGAWHDLQPLLPVPAGGMSVERVAEIVAFYGRDVMLLIGGSLLQAGDALPERARQFVAAVAAQARPAAALA